MITEKLMLNNIDSVNRFVALMMKKSYDVDLGSGKYLVNAKSVMGVLSLDLTRAVTVTAYTDDSTFLEEISDYIYIEK